MLFTCLFFLDNQKKNILFKLDISQFTNCDELNNYLQDLYNIPAFQHFLLQRLSIFGKFFIL